MRDNASIVLLVSGNERIGRSDEHAIKRTGFSDRFDSPLADNKGTADRFQ